MTPQSGPDGGGVPKIGAMAKGWMREALFGAAPPVELEAAAMAPRQVGPASWASEPNHLQAIVWSDLTGATATVLDRASVMAIPAVARLRHRLCGAAARCPLRVLTGSTPLPDEAQPYWTYRTDRTVHPYHRMLWTVDDQLFHGWSVWRTERSAQETSNQLLHAERIHPDHWEIDEVGRILVDDRIARADEVLALPGPHEGILNFGGNALRRTIDNLEAAANAARNPSAYLELHYTGDDPMTSDEIDAHIERWAKARRGENGGVAWTNKVLELKEHGTHEAHLLIEGRNADAVDMARLVSAPAASADATNAGASLTYETTAGRNLQMIDEGVGLYMDAIAARLSMDDVVPRGQRVAFDTGQLTVAAPDATGPDQLD